MFPFIFYCEKNLYKFSPFIPPLYFLLWKEPLQIFTLYSSPLFSTVKRTSKIFTLYSSPLFSTVKRTSTNFHPLFLPFIFYCEKNLYKFSPFIPPLYFLLWKEPLQIFTLYSSPLFSTVKRTSTDFHPLFLPFIFYCEKNLYKFSPFILLLYFLLWKEPLQIFTLYSSPLFSTVKRTSTKFHPLFSTVKRTSTNFHHLFFPLFSTVKRTSTQNFTLYSSTLFSTVTRTSTNFHPVFFPFIFFCEKNLYKFSPCILLLYFLLWKETLQIFTLYSSPLFSTVKRTSSDFHPLFFSFIFYC